MTELHLLVDGRPARLGPNQFARKAFEPGQEKDAAKSWTVTLEPGDHKLSVRAHAPDTYSLPAERKASSWRSLLSLIANDFTGRRSNH